MNKYRKCRELLKRIKGLKPEKGKNNRKNFGETDPNKDLQLQEAINELIVL